MAALALPLNAAGVPLPPIPGNPSLLSDISNAKEYIDRLAASKREPLFSTTSADLEVTSVAGQPNAATDAEIGAGEVYKAAVVFSHNPGGNVAPAWLANLTATVNQIALDVAYLRQKADELPILLANSQAGARGPLFNPTVLQNGWAPLLTAPNPRSRDELLGFTGEFTRHFHIVVLILFVLQIVNQCNASAHSLGLPALPPQTLVPERRRQIAVRIGVSIE